MNKIKIAFDPKTGLYMGSSSELRSNSNRKILVDEEEIQNPFGTSTVVLKGKPSKVITITMGRNFIGWEDLKTGTSISIEEYDSLRKEMIRNGVQDDETYEWEFEEVEDQVRYLRFDKAWTRKYTEEPTVGELEIEIIEHPVSEIPEIIGSFSTGGNSIFDTICEYRLNSAHLFKKRCEHFGITKGKNEYEKGNVYWLEDRYDNFRFAKLGGNYCSSDELNRSVRVTARGSYEDLKKIHESNVEKIDLIIKNWISKQNQKELDIITIGKQISFMDNLLENVRKLDVKKSDCPAQSSILRSIRENLESLTTKSE